MAGKVKSIEQSLQYKLDKEEQGVLDAYERGEMKRSADADEEIRIVREVARATLPQRHKDKRVNIRIAEGDLAEIKDRALEEGIPYQTLMASVLHKYVTGRLVEKK